MFSGLDDSMTFERNFYVGILETKEGNRVSKWFI